MLTGIQNSIEPAQEDLHFFPLEDVLGPGRAMVVNVEEPFVSLVSTAPGTGYNPILKQQRLRPGELRVLLSLLASQQGFCSDELLLASLDCPWKCLLDGLFTRSTARLQAAVRVRCEALQAASDRGLWADTLKPLYNVLYTLRRKIRCLGLWVDSSPSGYALISLPAPRPTSE